MKVFNLNKYFAILTLLLLIDCALGGFIGVWRDWYWTSLQKMEFSKWVLYVSEFSIVALISCGVSGYSQYLCNILSLKMRTNLTRKAIKSTSYQAIEGGAQRVQEDCWNYPQLLISLIGSGLRSCIMIVVFSTIILFSLPWYYLLLPLAYSIWGTIFAAKIAKPLIYLNYLNQVVEAAFRQTLSKLKYKQVHANNHKLFIKTKYLQYFQSFYSQITIIIPHLVLSFLYFSGKITFGIFMQIAASMTEIINSLSIIILSLNDINKFLSCRKRLKEIGVL